MAISRNDDNSLDLNSILEQIGARSGDQADFISLGEALGLDVTQGNDVILPGSFVGKDLSLTATTITVSPIGLQFDATDEAETLSVSSNGIFRVSSAPSWVSLNRTFGTGQTSISVFPRSNDDIGNLERTGTIVFTGANNTDIKTITVSQTGSPLTATITPTTNQSVSNASGTSTIVVELSNTLTVDSATLTNTTGFTLSGPEESVGTETTTYTYTITRTANDGAARSTTFNLSYSGFAYGSSFSRTYTQAAYVPTVSFGAIGTFVQGGEKKSIAVSSNTDWTVDVTGTGFTIATSENGTYGTSKSGTGNSTIWVKTTLNSGITRSGGLSATTTHGNGTTEATATKALTQTGLPSFELSDITITGFDVDFLGAITAPTVTTDGINQSITYTTAANSGTAYTTFPLVNSNTTRYCNVTVDVPDTYADNGTYPYGGNSVTKTVSAVQELAPTFEFSDWTGTVSIDMYGTVSVTNGNAQSVSFTPSSFAKVASNTNRYVSVTVTPPVGYYNVGTALAASNVLAVQPKFVPSLSISATTLDLVRAGTAQNFTVTSNTTWEFSSVASWINLSVSSGTGTKAMTIGADAQVIGAPARSDVITVTTTSTVGTNISKNITISQVAGIAATLGMNPNDNFDLDIDGTAIDADITSNTSWYFSSVASWVNISSTSGTGNTAISISTDGAAIGETAKTDNIILYTNSPGGINTSVTGITVTQVKGVDATISITDSSIGSLSGTGGSQTVTVSSNTNWSFASIASWVTVSPSSGTAGDTEVTITAASQVPGASARSDNMTLTTNVPSPGTVNTSVTVSVAQNARLATVDATPEPYTFSGAGNAKSFAVASNTTWEVTAKPDWVTIDDTTGGGTDTAFIATAGAQSANAAARSGTMTVTTTSPGGNDVSDNVTLYQRAGEYITLTGDTSIDPGGETLKGFTVDTSGDFSTAWTVTVDNNPAWVTLISKTGTGDGTPTVTFAANPYGGSNRSATLRVAKNGSTTIKDALTVSQPVLPQWTINKSSMSFGYYNTTSQGVTISTTMPWSSTVTGNFEQSKSSTTGFTQSVLTGTGGDVIYIRNTGNNNSGNTYTGTWTVSETDANYSFQPLSVGLSQPSAPLFTYATANVGGFAVSNRGAVTDPTAQLGTISNSADWPNSYTPVTSATNRTIDVDVTAPAGYRNAGDTVSGQETATQAAVPHDLILSVNDSSVEGNVTSVTLTVNDVYYTNTAWTITEADYPGFTGLSNPTFPQGNTGAGDGSVILSFSSNISTGTTRLSILTVSADSYISSDDVTVSQTSYTPGATINSVTVSAQGNSSFTWDWDHDGSYYDKVVSVNVVGVHTGFTFSMPSTFDFSFVDYGTGDGGITLNDYGSVVTGESTDGSSYTYKIKVRANNQNTTVGDNTNTLTMKVFYSQNGGGNDTETRTLTQTEPPAFTFANWTGTAAVAASGTISFTNGNATSVSNYPAQSFGTVTTATSRTVNCRVTVPSGYSNAGSTVDGTKTVTQPATTSTPCYTYTFSTNGFLYSYTACNGTNYSYVSTYPGWSACIRYGTANVGSGTYTVSSTQCY